MARRRICLLSELSEGRTLKFEFSRDGVEREGFVARCGGLLVAYENVCRHLPLPLDQGEGRFFTGNGQHFICQTHGAIYEPETGLCVRGPCEGLTLKRLSVEISDNTIWLAEEADAQ
jgi:nitrite reductase/ring-hydroxylating ferredoxin subunit